MANAPDINQNLENPSEPINLNGFITGNLQGPTTCCQIKHDKHLTKNRTRRYPVSAQKISYREAFARIALNFFDAKCTFGGGDT